MEIEEVADILFDYLKKRNCPRESCDGSLRLEVRRQKGNTQTKLVITVSCKKCGARAVVDSYQNNEVFENKISLRGQAEKVHRELITTLDNFYNDVAERMMSSI
jgi:hypothetical protein